MHLNLSPMISNFAVLSEHMRTAIDNGFEDTEVDIACGIKVSIKLSAG